jgi:hypothetical protein
MPRALFVVAFALVLGGCGTYSWYHPNVPPDIVQRDSAECREQARRLVTWELMDDDPFWGSRRRWRTGTLGPMTSGLAMEQDVHDRCMRYKGYTLVKDPEPGHPAGSP